MKPLSPDEITGTWGTILLPIQEDDSIDYARLADQIDVLTRSGLSGLYSGGTAGEFYTLSEEEFDRVNSMLAERCEAVGMPFQIGATHTSAQTTLQRVARAVRMKPSAIQVILPDWYPLSDDEVVRYLQRVGEAAEPVGIVLYNPPHAKRVLPPATYERLAAAIPNLVGLKVGGGDAAWYQAMKNLAGRLSLFIPGHYMATGIQHGASGSYSNVACLHPTGAQAWYQLARSDIHAALHIEGKIQQFMEAYIHPLGRQGYSNAALDKLLAAIGGWTDAGTRLRWPYRGISESEAVRLRPVARAMIPELFPSHDGGSQG